MTKGVYVENLTEELSLSRTNRLIGFATCLAMGFFFIVDREFNAHNSIFV